VKPKPAQEHWYRVAISNLPTRIWSALSCSSAPDIRNLSGHRC